MATTNFEVIHLGTLARIDTTQGNDTAENAAGILGTYGSTSDPLFNHVSDLVATRLSEDDNSTYDTDNGGGYDTFTIDGGADQDFDAYAIYNATLTYADGSTANITAVVFQDTAGRTYLAPETSLNADQAALTAGPILSLTLSSVVSATGDMTGAREFADFIQPVDGTSGADTMTFGYTDADGDQITNGNDLIDAGAGDDSVVGEGGVDTIFGGLGNDTLLGGGGSGNVLFGEEGDDELWNGAGDDSAYGGDGDDLIHADQGADYLDGGDGDDTFSVDNVFGAFNSDTIVGGETGEVLGDLIDLSGMNAAVTVTYTGDEAGWISDGISTLTFSEIERLVLSDFADRLDASGDSVGIDVDAGSGNDTITGGSGDDLADGGLGNDTLIGGIGADTLIGGAGDDLLTGQDDNDLVQGGTGNDTLYGGAGADTVSYADATGPMSINLEFGFATDSLLIEWDELYDFEAVIGSDFDDVISGGGADETLLGGAGDDWLVGNAGADVLSGGDGNDNIGGGAGDDVVLAGDGDDFVDASSSADGSDLIYGEAGNDTLQHDQRDQIVDGGVGNDYIVNVDGTSSTYATTIIGGDGIDTYALDSSEGGVFNSSHIVDLSLGHVTYLGAIRDYISEIENVEIIGSGAGAIGDAGDNRITGTGDFGNSFDGGAGADTIDGGGGGDTITGGTGNDSLTGGTGNDTFVYAAGDGADTIADFNTGNTGTISDGNATNNDFIDLSAFYDNIQELYADQADDGVLNQSNATDTKGRAVDYTNNSDFGTGSLTFTGAAADSTFYTQENTGVVCFASGTLIRTPEGDVPVETLAPGDPVVTCDNGVQPIVWIGKRHLSPPDLDRAPNLRPVRLAADLLGASRPLIVSPQHGVVLRSQGAERLIRAIHLARLRGGQARIMQGRKTVTYHHIMFEAHQIILANGAPCESFYPGPEALRALCPSERRDLFALFPTLESVAVDLGYGPTSRRFARFGALPDSLRALSRAAP